MTLTPVPKPPRTVKKPKYLTRRTTIKAKRSTPRRMTAVKDDAFRRWIREQPCLLTIIKLSYKKGRIICPITEDRKLLEARHDL